MCRYCAGQEVPDPAAEIRDHHSYSDFEVRVMAERMGEGTRAVGMDSSPSAWGWPPHDGASDSINDAWEAFWGGEGPNPHEARADYASGDWDGS